ncbi:MAG: NUDIX domain-containing protein [Patescibacteria group bacterium]|nr:NUDIX domain-containing protein [Patescibacteria group bacterium]
MKPGVDFIGISTPFYCNDGKGLFLFHKRSKNCRDEHGAWDVGSGKLEFGLTPEENVLKEVLEEYGCHGEIQEAFPVHSMFREWQGQKTHWIAIPFFIKINPAEVQINEPESMDEIGWFSLDALPDPLHTGFRYTFERYHQHFEKYWRKR